ncbi:HNH endonuclease [Caldimonas taiwanensis]|uniref:HNH endonuclease n=1 Tax=Caldimonas taiwanensis TaxID=307483 RepID=UPI000A07A765|nr:HNH endonuclease [Caldimonas taiwanensis]
MTTETWHSEFNPSKFLSRVNLAQLIERNEAYNENTISDAKAPCILCGKTYARGILLNDKSFLCQQCYSEVALISYPERYEVLRRQFVVAMEARRLAWDGFREKYEHKSEESALVFLGWASTLLAFANPAFLILTAILLAVGYSKNSVNKQKTEEWLSRKKQWEQSNPIPAEPTLKHFHDPTAELTQRDRQILKIFNHWPGYPPFWKYLRSVVISRDSNRCQVTGCPSRLELHVHHMRPVAEGGTHSPDNLVSLCDFHHALEPEKGHERIWGDIKTRYFTLVCTHERSNRASGGTHQVKAHLRRLQLVTLDELRELTKTYGFCCPSCGETKIKFLLFSDKNLIKVECPTCQKAAEVPQQLTEETGPLLAEVLGVTQNKGRWKARWDMLSERKNSTWGIWSGHAVSAKRKHHKEKVETSKSAPLCPKCGAPMRLKRPWKPSHTWKPFWGCTQYDVTGCKGSERYVDTNS